MNAIQSAWALVKENKRAYIFFNVLYYGLGTGFYGRGGHEPSRAG
jgi:hypothetical protein